MGILATFINSNFSGEEKITFILFSKTRGLREINVSFADHAIKQHETVEYLVC